jgi:SAM-dependent methyltransferase
MGHHDHGHHDHGHHDDGNLAELLELESEVLQDHLTAMVGFLPELTSPRILDVGAGTGNGTLTLLRRYPDAQITALDISPEMLARLAKKAEVEVETIQADLDSAWPQIALVDLVWASNSLHHMADPDHALGEIFARLKPDGVLAVAEMDSFPRFTGDAAEDRAQVEIAKLRAEDMPHLGDNWGEHLTRAGFTVEREQTFDVDLTPPLPPAAGRFASASFRRMREGLAERLGADDLARLEVLSQNPPDFVRTARTVWLARRPISAK